MGGPARVERERLFEFAWWGEGLGEAAAYVAHVAAPGARVKIQANPGHVITLRPDLRRVAADADADYVIVNRLDTAPFSSAAHEPVHTVRAGSAPLCWVHARR